MRLLASSISLFLALCVPFAVVDGDSGGKGTCSVGDTVLDLHVPAGDATPLRNAWECAHNRRFGQRLTINLGGDITLQVAGAGDLYGLYLRPGGKLLLRKAPEVLAERVVIKRVPISTSESAMPGNIQGTPVFGLIDVGSESSDQLAELILENIELKWGYLDHANTGAALRCSHATCRELCKAIRNHKS